MQFSDCEEVMMSEGKLFHIHVADYDKLRDRNVVSMNSAINTYW